MQRATEKITALYCRLSVEDMKDDKNGGKGDVSNSIQNQKNDPAPVRKRASLPQSDFLCGTMGTAAPTTTAPGFQAMLAEIEAGKVAVCCTKRPIQAG